MTTWQEQAATCAAGDPDPSPGESAGEFCLMVHNGWRCSLPAEHVMQHVAGDFVEVCAVWPVTPCSTCGGSGRVADLGTAHLPAGHPATDDVACPTCGGA